MALSGDRGQGEATELPDVPGEVIELLGEVTLLPGVDLAEGMVGGLLGACWHFWRGNVLAHPPLLPPFSPAILDSRSVLDLART